MNQQFQPEASPLTRTKNVVIALVVGGVEEEEKAKEEEEEEGVCVV